jgi:hypothetical protein
MKEILSSIFHILEEYEIFLRFTWSAGILYGSLILALLLTPFCSYFRKFSLQRESVERWIVPGTLFLCLSGHLSGAVSIPGFIVQGIAFTITGILLYSAVFHKLYIMLRAGFASPAGNEGRGYRLLCASFIRRHSFYLVARFHFQLWLVSLLYEFCNDDSFGVGAGVKLTFKDWNAAHATTVIISVVIIIFILDYLLHKTGAITSPWRAELGK